jgi:hypothetical protein
VDHLNHLESMSAPVLEAILTRHVLGAGNRLSTSEVAIARELVRRARRCDRLAAALRGMLEERQNRERPSIN